MVDIMCYGKGLPYLGEVTSIGGEAIHPISPAKLDSLLVPAVHCSLVQVPTNPGEKVSDPNDIDDQR